MATILLRRYRGAFQMGRSGGVFLFTGRGWIGVDTKAHECARIMTVPRWSPTQTLPFLANSHDECFALDCITCPCTACHATWWRCDEVAKIDPSSFPSLFTNALETYFLRDPMHCAREGTRTSFTNLQILAPSIRVCTSPEADSPPSSLLT